MTEERLIEVCCGGIDDVKRALEGGADRIELCSALGVEGVTPSLALIHKAVEIAGNVPVIVLVRPREGNFVYTEAEMELMASDVHLAINLGAAGVSIGVLTGSNEIDIDALKLLKEMAKGHDVVFNRAFDQTPDLLESLAVLETLGIPRVLTSGGPEKALWGMEKLRMLKKISCGTTVLACGGIRPDNIEQIEERTGIREFHSSARDKVEPRYGDTPLTTEPVYVNPDIVRCLHRY